MQCQHCNLKGCFKEGSVTVKQFGDFLLACTVKSLVRLASPWASSQDLQTNYSAEKFYGLKRRRNECTEEQVGSAA
jgi:hypothetical protein